MTAEELRQQRIKEFASEWFARQPQWTWRMCLMAATFEDSFLNGRSDGGVPAGLVRTIGIEDVKL